MLRRSLLVLTVLILTGCSSNPDTSSNSVPAYTPPPGFQILGGQTPTLGVSPTSPSFIPEPVVTSTPRPIPSPTSTQPPASPTPPPIITILFTGQIVPGRCVQAGVEEAGNADYIYAEVKDLISRADLAVGTLNAALSDYPPTTGCVQTFVLVGRSVNADAIAQAGFDVMSVATNHIKNCGLSNCGDRAFLDTLDNLKRVGVKAVGAGTDLEEANQPVMVTVKGIQFVFVSLGEIEASAFASESSPGIAPLTRDSIRSTLAAARELGDVVIFLPHWGPEYSASPTYSQQDLASLAVDSGADLVVGNHTHVVQGITTIAGVPVFYGLGNFVFDQTWSSETRQGIMVRVTFEGTKYLSHEIIPIEYDQNGQVHIANKDLAVEILTRIQNASEGLP